MNNIYHRHRYTYLSCFAEKRLKRGISKSVENSNIVIRQRELILQDIHENGLNSEIRFEWSKYTFMLPDTTSYPEDLRAFLHKELIETSTLVSLEQAGIYWSHFVFLTSLKLSYGVFHTKDCLLNASTGRLNWWADIGACQRLLPFATTRDGNCLLHAASLGMYVWCQPRYSKCLRIKCLDMIRLQFCYLVLWCRNVGFPRPWAYSA